MALIENIKKSTKEYFFEKKFDKMMHRLKRNERTFSKDSYDNDYEKDIDQCLKIVEKAGYFQSNKQNGNKNNKTYMQLMEELNGKIHNYKVNFMNKMKKKHEKRTHKKNPTQQLED